MPTFPFSLFRQRPQPQEWSEFIIASWKVNTRQLVDHRNDAKSRGEIETYNLEMDKSAIIIRTPSPLTDAQKQAIRDAAKPKSGHSSLVYLSRSGKLCARPPAKFQDHTPASDQEPNPEGEAHLEPSSQEPNPKTEAHLQASSQEPYPAHLQTSSHTEERIASTSSP